MKLNDAYLVKSIEGPFVLKRVEAIDATGQGYVSSGATFHKITDNDRYVGRFVRTLFGYWKFIPAFTKGDK